MSNEKAQGGPAENLKPIGVFDSGIGGLTVVSALRTLLPNESMFYLGDTARVPYGGKSASTVQRYSLEIASMLLEESAKTVVVACNTASAVALSQLSESVPVTVTGVILPGAQAAQRDRLSDGACTGIDPNERAADGVRDPNRPTGYCDLGGLTGQRNPINDRVRGKADPAHEGATALRRRVLRVREQGGSVSGA